jgi:hypothetical protein
MPGIIYLRRLKKCAALSGFKLRVTRFDQGDATDAARQAYRHGDTDRPRSNDRDLNLCFATFG